MGMLTFEALFETAGGTNGGLEVAKGLIAGGANPIIEARRAAGRGVLSTAAEYIQASPLSKTEKVALLQECATAVQRKLLEQPSSVDQQFSMRATAVNVATIKLLQLAIDNPV